jgi:bacterioferritin-associated ferredoxin
LVIGVRLPPNRVTPSKSDTLRSAERRMELWLRLCKLWRGSEYCPLSASNLDPSQRRFWTRIQGVSRSRLGSRLTPIGSQCGRRSTVLRGSMRAVSVQFSFHAAPMIRLSRRALRSRPHTHDKTEVRPTGTECGSVCPPIAAALVTANSSRQSRARA